MINVSILNFSITILIIIILTTILYIRSKKLERKYNDLLHILDAYTRKYGWMKEKEIVEILDNYYSKINN